MVASLCAQTRSTEAVAEVASLHAGDVFDDAEQVGSRRCHRPAHVVFRQPLQLPHQHLAPDLEISVEVGLCGVEFHRQSLSSLQQHLWSIAWFRHWFPVSAPTCSSRSKACALKEHGLSVAMPSPADVSDRARCIEDRSMVGRWADRSSRHPARRARRFSATVLLANPADFAGMNAEYAKVFVGAPPTRVVAKLGVELANVLVSIMMTAHVDG